MGTHRVPPLPSPVFIPIKLISQARMNIEGTPETDKDLYRFMDEVSDALVQTLHTHGVTCTNAIAYDYCDKVVFTLNLEAGSWHRRATFMVERKRNPVRTLCAKALRLLKRENDLLG